MVGAVVVISGIQEGLSECLTIWIVKNLEQSNFNFLKLKPQCSGLSYKNGEREQPSAGYDGVACNPVTPKQDSCQLEANPGSWGAEAQLGVHGKDNVLEVSNFLCPPY